MYKISIPVVVHERFCKEDVLRVLKESGAERVFLATDIISLDDEKRNNMLALLRENVPFFKANGLETGIWFWTFWRGDLHKENADSWLMKGHSGNKRISQSLVSNEDNPSGFCCPASKDFLENTLEIIKNIAETDPDILMFDDDFRYGFLDKTLGCYCDTHMRIMEEKLGEPISPEKLHSEVFSGKPNRYRTLWHEAMGESLENFALEVRQAVDSVNPEIRFALCSVMSLWDVDGTNSIKIAKILAGKTKPLMRLIGAPYWAVNRNWGNRLQHIIELERMEYSWCDGENIEIMTEGDVYPRPRYKVPSNYLEGFDTALRAAGVGDGILKYMMDYISSADYEKGYIHRHLKNADIYTGIHQIFSGKNPTGVRVYETMKKFCDADFTDIPNPDEYASHMFFSVAARVLSDNTVPTIYNGNDGAGIAFGENARNLPPEAFENGLIIDIRAAKILMEKGIDVGIEKIGDKLLPDLLWYKEENEYVRSSYNGNSVYEIIPKANADVLTYSFVSDQKYPDTFTYQNKNGQKFLVFAFDAAFINEDRYRTYCMQSQLYRSIEWLSGKPLPAKCFGNPDSYILCKKSVNGIAVGLWNFFADEITLLVIELDKAYEKVEFVNCTGTLEDNKITLSSIPPYGFAFFHAC